MKTTSLLILLFLTAIGGIRLVAETAKELGDVDWLRKYEDAVAASKKTKKPILILFQEVPGCQGCINYGQSTLSNPIIVDAIEEHFIPLAIHNNKGGYDRKILERFNEPAWNFQVMRFIDADGKDIIPRKDRVWTPAATAKRMIEALEAVKAPVPKYLRTVTWTDSSNELKTGVFSMYCFWDGEAKLGSIEGVIETEAGWLDGHEVVRLSYDSKTIQWKELVELASAQGCARNVYAPDKETLSETPEGSKALLFHNSTYRTSKQSDQKRHLQFSKLKELKLNPMQRTKINAAISQKDTAVIQQWLSPSQIKIL
ncbi:MAG: VPGUxxT family thioredoxin-like (seleno)protein, type 2 [Opitutaceae bacterium]